MSSHLFCDGTPKGSACLIGLDLRSFVTTRAPKRPGATDLPPSHWIVVSLLNQRPWHSLKSSKLIKSFQESVSLYSLHSGITFWSSAQHPLNRLLSGVTSLSSVSRLKSSSHQFHFSIPVALVMAIFSPFTLSDFESLLSQIQLREFQLCLESQNNSPSKPD